MDLMAEIRQAIVKAGQRYNRYFHGARALETGPAVLAPANPNSARVDPGVETNFTTGYDSGAGVTTVPLMWDVSTWGSDDVWTG